MLHTIFLFFCVIFLPSFFIANDSNKTNAHEYNIKREQTTKFTFTFRIKKTLDPKNLVTQYREICTEYLQKKLQQRLNLLQKLQEKFLDRQCASITTSSPLGATLGGVGPQSSIAGITRGNLQGQNVSSPRVTNTTIKTPTPSKNVISPFTEEDGARIAHEIRCATTGLLLIAGACQYVYDAIFGETTSNTTQQTSTTEAEELQRKQVEEQRALLLKREQCLRLQYEQYLNAEEKERICLQQEQEEELLRLKLESIFLQQNVLFLKYLKQITTHNNFVSCITIPKDIGKSELSIYVPIHSGPPVCVYIPAQYDAPAYIYVPATRDNPPCIYVPTKEEQKELMLYFSPVVSAGAGIIGGGFGVGIGAVSGGVVPIAVGTGLAVGWIVKEGVPLFNALKEKIKKHLKEKKGGGGGGGDDDDNNDDDDDDEKKKDKNHVRKLKNKDEDKYNYRNGIYENNSKHHQNSTGKISKPPRDGQKALDESIQIPNNDRKVAIENDYFVMLHEHEPGKYHGYIVKNFNDLLPAAQNALKKAKLVHPKNGKILK